MYGWQGHLGGEVGAEQGERSFPSLWWQELSADAAQVR